jgi:hypothetical protein
MNYYALVIELLDMRNRSPFFIMQIVSDFRRDKQLDTLDLVLRGRKSQQPNDIKGQ